MEYQNIINLNYGYRESEDGLDVYKVEFRSGGMEYDYEIRVSDGTILESESEPINS